jgi:hypothetical protein
MNEENEIKEQKSDNKKLTVKEFFEMSEFWGYFFRKKDPNRPMNFNIRAMHGINKLSILMFLVALIVLIIRRLF